MMGAVGRRGEWRGVVAVSKIVAPVETVDSEAIVRHVVGQRPLEMGIEEEMWWWWLRRKTRARRVRGA
jgi:hypothetical protein